MPRIILTSPMAASRATVAMKNITPAGTPSIWFPGIPSAGPLSYGIPIRVAGALVSGGRA